MSGPLEDEEQARLLRLIAEQHRDAPRAVRRLYEHYRRPVITFFARHRIRAERAEEMFQDFMLKIVRFAGQHAGGSATGWAWAIARNVLRSEWKNPQADVASEPNPDTNPSPDDADTPSVDLGGEASAGDAHAVDRCVQRQLQAFEKVEPERAMAVRQVNLEGWSIRQLAAFLDRTEGATREYLSQCRKRFAPFLAECLELLKP